MSTDDVRPRGDEVVSRLREESAWRLAREARWRTFAAWCAVVTLGAGISLAALDVRPSEVTDLPAARTDLPAARPFAPARPIEHGDQIRTPTAPAPPPAIEAPKKRRCYLWAKHDLFDPFARSYCVAWRASSARRYGSVQGM